MFWDEYQAGHRRRRMAAAGARMTRSPGTCNTMGTASTMTAIVEALGLTLPGSHQHPGHGRRTPRMATDCGERIVGHDLGGPDAIAICSRAAAFLNAMAVQMALGGSTNAAVHIMAMARRAGVALTLDDLDAMGAPRAGAGQPVPQRRPADGRLLLRRRPAGADAP
jgi:dihydroxyacid dehydratase/phosphogluconate dehydratase